MTKNLLWNESNSRRQYLAGLLCASQFWGTMNVLICCFCHLMKTKKKTRKSLKNNKNKGQFNFFNFWTECWSKIWVNLISSNISQHCYAHGNPGGITLMTSFLFLLFEKKLTRVIGKSTTESIGKNFVILIHGYCLKKL